jgi:hypothetical protein
MKSAGIPTRSGQVKSGATTERARLAVALLVIACCGTGAYAQKEPPKTWHPVEFAIVKLNDEPPISWNMYHTGKKGVILLHLWKRYLLINMQEEELYDIDPQKVKNVGDSVEWSYSDLPLKAIDTPDWRDRDIGTMKRIRFKLGGPDHHYLELQIPLLINGKPLY